ncbi:carbohydrate ABC transporter permease [Virgisporangium aurantiacum]|uniref:ABC transporter permease n=1 Tax=Virgisporangium aurantiacum TaxID=175570 RepID=A0A8J3Z316_9ACTN|nr:carbohydrate ABC transporter permease [Virgisporangium aurantiacum]GIJ55398.1 ABC transporter permease [Virgisporangium aurantiacum]
MTVQTMDPVRRKRRPGRPAWEEPPTAVGQTAKTVVLAIVVLAVVFPLWSIAVTSVSSRETINETGGMVVIPRDFDLSAYITIFAGGQVTNAVWISTLVSVVGAAFSLTLTVLAAYGLSRPNSVGHRAILFYFLMTFLIYPGMVPSYLVVTAFGLKDNIWALVLPSAISAFNLVVIRAFFMNVPQELLDSARLDGAGELGILWRIVLPLSKAVIAVVGLFYAVGYWNAFFTALLYIDDNDKWPVQRLLQSYILAGQTPNVSGSSVGVSMPPTLAIKMAVVIITVAPIVAVYPFVQRHFVKGVIVGAVKG